MSVCVILKNTGAASNSTVSLQVDCASAFGLLKDDELSRLLARRLPKGAAPGAPRSSRVRMTAGLAALDLLVVDDNAQMRTIVGTVLAAAGVRRLHYAPDARRGLEIIKHGLIDVIFVDYEMPTMNGLDFLSAVRSLDTQMRFTPIIMLTGHSDLKRITAARDRGVNEFLGKPVTAKSILQRLDMVIMKPRPFVSASHYFGPDRRRKAQTAYEGPRRRASDAHAVLEL
jgi:CheY-like chemotaxis protein